MTATPPNTVLSFQPASLDIFPEQTGELVVWLDDVTNVYGIDISIAFDPANLVVVDANPAEPGIQIAPGGCPQPDSVLFNIVHNGSIAYAVTQLNPTPACNGGEVATIQFQCLAPSTSSTITWNKTLIADPDGFAISHSSMSAKINCVEETPGFFNFLPTILNFPAP